MFFSAIRAAGIPATVASAGWMTRLRAAAQMAIGSSGNPSMRGS
jgi:hypothetical protein